MWLFLTVPMSPTAKEALPEDSVVHTADPGFREGVEGKEVKRGPCPHAACFGWVVPPSCCEKGLLGPLCDTGTVLLWLGVCIQEASMQVWGCFCP